MFAAILQARHQTDREENMKKNGIYFTKQKETQEEEEKNLRRKGIFTALVFVALALAGIAIFIVVRTNGVQNLVVLLLALAVIALSIEIYWSNPDKKSFVLWKRLFNRQ